MSYTTIAAVIGLLPLKYITQALDDDKDGAIDPAVETAVLASVDKTINGYLGTRFTVPFPAPFPDLVSAAAEIFLIEQIHIRRGAASDKAGWAAQASDMRKKLTRIGSGQEPLTPEIKRARPSGSAIVERSKTFSSRGQTPI